MLDDGNQSSVIALALTVADSTYLAVIARFERLAVVSVLID
jgi:hypothetical protein